MKRSPRRLWQKAAACIMALLAGIGNPAVFATTKFTSARCTL